MSPIDRLRVYSSPDLTPVLSTEVYIKKLDSPVVKIGDPIVIMLDFLKFVTTPHLS